MVKSEDGDNPDAQSSETVLSRGKAVKATCKSPIMIVTLSPLGENVSASVDLT